MATLQQMHRTGPHIKVKQKKSPFDGKPFMKGVVLKTLIKKPKKPNSANRKCVLVRLSSGKEMVAYVPGIGHNLQVLYLFSLYKKMYCFYTCDCFLFILVPLKDHWNR